MTSLPTTEDAKESNDGAGTAMFASLLLKDHSNLSDGSTRDKPTPFVTPDKYVDRFRFGGIPRSPFQTPPGGNRTGSFKTPSSKFSGSGPRFNPFEVDVHHMTMASCSPSVFASVVSPSVSDKECRWSIDHIASLKPANISESPHALQYKQRNDPAYESQLQDAIDTFFSQAEIVPSPMGDPVPKPAFRLSTHSSLHDTEKFSASTQTALSFPPVLPKHVEDILSEYMNECCVERLPFVPNDLEDSSSLRRKLFECLDSGSEDDEDYRDGSPVLVGRVDLNDSMCTEAPTRGSFCGTPQSTGLSSSPITPPDVRMASLMDETSSSPPISPIAHLKSRLISENSKTARKIDMDQEDMSVISFSDVFTRRNEVMSSTAFPVARDFDFTKIQPITEQEELDESGSSQQDHLQGQPSKPFGIIDTGYSTFFHSDSNNTNHDLSVPCAGTITGVKRPLPVSPAVSREPGIQVGTPIGSSTPTK